MAKNNNLVWLILSVIGLIIVFSVIGVFIVFDIPQSIISGGLRNSTFTSSKSCDKLMSDIGNPSKALPFTWQYSKTAYRCVQSYKIRGSGCQVIYTANRCLDSVSVVIPTVVSASVADYSDWGVSCQQWAIQEKSICRGDYQLIKLEDKMDFNREKWKEQNRCAITYQKGCYAQPRCRLFYGNGNPNNRNIIVTADKGNEPLSLVTAGITAYTLKNRYPFKDYSDKFNVYIINNVTVDNAFKHWYDSDAKDIFSACSIRLGDVIIPSKTYLSVCEGNEQGCMWPSWTSFGTSNKIDVTSDFYGIGSPSNYAHELMHSGGAIGESYGENAQMWSNASVTNVINWILRK